jgi:adenylate cyclase class IV
MHNVEYKAELRNIEAARLQCHVLGAARIGVLQQTDEYFKMTEGRLKRRTAPDEPVEWIHYNRPDQVSPRVSDYTLLSEEQARRKWGTHSLQPWLTVVKTRELWMLDNVRIHLDEVAELGNFIEFEAMVSLQNDTESCHAMVAMLRDTFGPVLGEPVAASYSDLMAQD